MIWKFGGDIGLLSNPKAVKSLKQGLKEAKAGKFYSCKDIFGEEQRGKLVSRRKRSKTSRTVTTPHANESKQPSAPCRTPPRRQTAERPLSKGPGLVLLHFLFLSRFQLVGRAFRRTPERRLSVGGPACVPLPPVISAPVRSHQRHPELRMSYFSFHEGNNHSRRVSVADSSSGNSLNARPKTESLSQHTTAPEIYTGAC
jgi:hypothetical protein